MLALVRSKSIASAHARHSKMLIRGVIGRNPTPSENNTFYSSHSRTESSSQSKMVMPIGKMRKYSINVTNVRNLIGSNVRPAYFSSAVTDNVDDKDEEEDDTFDSAQRNDMVRNVAIVAHVDHGKTTLVDQLLKCAHESENESDILQSKGDGVGSDGALLMDCGELEKERGITITSKVTRLDYHHGRESGSVINVVDTPGHADFAGEVDRILSMIDGVCLVVDAAEGVMVQTRYVLSRALKMSEAAPVVVFNKCDRDDAWARIEDGGAEMELLEAFDSLGASERQMEYVTVYASAKANWATVNIDEARRLAKMGKNTDDSTSIDNDTVDTTNATSDSQPSMKILLDLIVKHIPAPIVEGKVGHGLGVGESKSKGEIEGEERQPFAMAVTTVGYDSYLGRLCTGRIYSGSIRKNDTVTLLPRDFSESDNNDGDNITSSSSSSSSSSSLLSAAVSGIFVTRGVTRTDLVPPVAHAGDIVTLSGLPRSTAVGDTLTLTSNPIFEPIKTPPINPPTLTLEIGPNTSPLSGRESENTIVSGGRLRERLRAETDNNVALSMSKSKIDNERTVVNARGELQVGVLVEQMRREGYEMTVMPPRIVTTTCATTGKMMEPYEEVTVDIDADRAGTVIESLTGTRGGMLLEMSDREASSSSCEGGATRMIFEVPARGLLGFASEIASATRGTAVVNHAFLENRECAGGAAGSEPGSIVGERKGKLVANDTGKASMYALDKLAKRALDLFVAEGDEIYPGMVIGESSRPGNGDLEVNPVKSKAATNIRTVNKDEKLFVPPPKQMSLEEYMGYMDDDEVIEVTPTSIRLRKAELDSSVRDREGKKRKKRLMALAQKKSGRGR